MVKQIQLGEMVDINPESISKDFPHKEIEYIDISSVGSGSLINNPETIRLDVAPSRAKRKVQESDTILAMVRPNLRSFMYIRNPKENTIVSTGFAVLRPKDNVDPRFIYYCVSNPVFTGYLTNNAKGTSYPAVDTKTITRGYIPNFKFDDQEKIGQLLVLYDDLIVNNKRRIELLEESARQLYKEWFVRLRFPGHEHVKIIDGVPEGWLVNNLGSFVNIAKGKNITKNTVVHGEIPVVAGGLKPAYYHNKANTKGPVITVSASGANAGYVNLYHEDVWASDCSYIESEGELSIPFYYLMLKERQSEITLMQKGAAQPHVYPKDLMRLVINMPPKLLLEQFTDLVAASFNLIKVLELENKQLAYARDLLLPKLMNGEIAV